MKKTILALVLMLMASVANAQPRTEQVLTDGWQFCQGAMPDPNDKKANAKAWQTVSVPHDWAISGPFDKKWDMQRVAIVQNGEKEATEKTGRSGALPWIGEGHYRRTITIPTGTKHAELLFDGAMAEARVSINGKEAGYWPYGYNSFRVDITPFMHEGDNQLTVDLKNVEESSRWYPGAGIYRPVTLVLTNDVRLDPWETQFQTVSLLGGTAIARLNTRVVDMPQTPRQLSLMATLLGHNPDGRPTEQSIQTVIDAQGRCEMQFEIHNPLLWSPETPNLYDLTIQLRDGEGRIFDEITHKVGIRTISVTAEGGFQLNGVTRKPKGVCLHHDLGPLGAAVNKAALIRQVKTMKAMGCDAIRTAHNMPSQMQMDVCDSLGMMVMAESFDMWKYAKCKNGYARFFDEWADRDIETLVRAHRNHPSIVMWSIGNEIPEQGMKGGKEMARHLQDICHDLDPTRPVTQGMDRIDNAIKTGFAQVMDIPGMNYRLPKYQMAYEKLPQRFLLGSETASTVSSRGVYKFPVKPTSKGVYPDGQCSGYDVEWCSWSNLPDDDWVWQDDMPWVIGEFVWTGFDYLGEPTPYDEYWPSRSSYFGICDLAGLPKDRFWLYRSHWNKRERTIHLLPHWSWGTTEKDADNRIGQVTPVYCYTDYPEGELFVNGKSQGRIKKNPKERLDRYRLRWNDVVYEPGELKVVVYDEMGNNCGEKIVRTAGKADHLRLDTWTQHNNNEVGTGSNAATVGNDWLRADGEDLAYITVSLEDANGTMLPTANDQLSFEVKGAGTFRGVCNGDATSLEVFTKPTMRLFSGQLVVVVQAAHKSGVITLTVNDRERKMKRSINIEVK